MLGTGQVDILERLALDLDVDPDPPAAGRAGVVWSIYDGLRRHPDRHELIDLVARNGWGMDELARELHARFSARYDKSAAG